MWSLMKRPDSFSFVGERLGDLEREKSEREREKEREREMCPGRMRGTGWYVLSLVLPASFALEFFDRLVSSSSSSSTSSSSRHQAALLAIIASLLFSSSISDSLCSLL